MGIILKHFDKLHRARSHIRITLMGLILKHFQELQRDRSHVRIIWTGIFLKKSTTSQNTLTCQNESDAYYSRTFRQTS